MNTLPPHRMQRGMHAGSVTSWLPASNALSARSNTGALGQTSVVQGRRHCMNA